MVLTELQFTIGNLIANEIPKDRLLFPFTDRPPPNDYITLVQAHIIVIIWRGITLLQLLPKSFPRHPCYAIQQCLRPSEFRSLDILGNVIV